MFARPVVKLKLENTMEKIVYNSSHIKDAPDSHDKLNKCNKLSKTLIINAFLFLFLRFFMR